MDIFSGPRHRVDPNMPYLTEVLRREAGQTSQATSISALATCMERRGVALRPRSCSQEGLREALVLYLSHQIDCKAFYRRHEEAFQYFEVGAPMVE